MKILDACFWKYARIKNLHDSHGRKAFQFWIVERDGFGETKRGQVGGGGLFVVYACPIPVEEKKLGIFLLLVLKIFEKNPKS